MPTPNVMPQSIAVSFTDLFTGNDEVEQTYVSEYTGEDLKFVGPEWVQVRVVGDRRPTKSELAAHRREAAATKAANKRRRAVLQAQRDKYVRRTALHRGKDQRSYDKAFEAIQHVDSLIARGVKLGRWDS